MFYEFISRNLNFDNKKKKRCQIMVILNYALLALIFSALAYFLIYINVYYSEYIAVIPAVVAVVLARLVVSFSVNLKK